VTYSDDPAPRARQFTEPLREMSVFALLAGNAVFLVIGLSRLFLVINGWATQFGMRCAEVFPAFVGPYALGLPFLAVLLATHVTPMLPRTRLIVMAVLAEYAVSGFFGVLTFLGAFAHDLSSPRAVIEGVLSRGVWLGFLILATLLVFRVWRGLFPPPPPRPPVFGGYAPTTYGKPYPGQPMYPQPATPAQPSSAAPWPEVPPPPMPAPVALDPGVTARLNPVAAPESAAPESTAPTTPADAPTTDVPLADAGEPTSRLDLAPQPPDTGGEATQVVPAPDAAQKAPNAGNPAGPA